MTDPRPDPAAAGRPKAPALDPVERRLAELERCLLHLAPGQGCGRPAVVGEGRGLRCTLRRAE